MSRILVIDDQEHIRTVIKQLLLIDRHDVDVAENGKIGLKLVQQNQYDLVITDIVMPERDGLEVVLALRKEFPLIRIIVMTGGSAGIDIGNSLKTAKLFGADKVVSKPIDFTRLQSDVREVLGVTG